MLSPTSTLWYMKCPLTMEGEEQVHRCLGGGGGQNQKDLPFLPMSRSDAGTSLYARPDNVGDLCKPISADWTAPAGSERCRECADVYFDGMGNSERCGACQWQCGPEKEMRQREGNTRCFYSLSFYQFIFVWQQFCRLPKFVLSCAQMIEINHCSIRWVRMEINVKMNIWARRAMIAPPSTSKSTIIVHSVQWTSGFIWWLRWSS